MKIVKYHIHSIIVAILVLVLLYSCTKQEQLSFEELAKEQDIAIAPFYKTDIDSLDISCYNGYMFLSGAEFPVIAVRIVNDRRQYLISDLTFNRDWWIWDFEDRPYSAYFRVEWEEGETCGVVGIPLTEFTSIAMVHETKGLVVLGQGQAYKIIIQGRSFDPSEVEILIKGFQ